MNGIRRIYLYVTSLIAVLGCEEVLLIPETIKSDDLSASYPAARMLDGDYDTFWIGASWAEEVYYYFQSPVIVKGLLIQNSFKGELHFVRVYYGSGSKVLYYDSPHNTAKLVHMSKVNSQYIPTATGVRFLFAGSSSSGETVKIARAEVWGCYVTTTPTTFPTTLTPTTMPSSFPTAKPASNPTIVPTSSPSSSPTSTTIPTQVPSVSPTMRPTSTTSPSTVPTMAPSPTPSTVQSFSPTVQHMTLSSEPAGFRVILGINELLIIAAIFTVFFGGLFVTRRRKSSVSRVMDASTTLELAESNARSRVQRLALDAEDQIQGEDQVNI